MKLSEKGTFQRRPTLDGPSEHLARAIEAWPGVLARTHWELGDETTVDGADFYVGDRELGHIHLYAEAHLALSAALKQAVLDAKLARPFRWSDAFVVIRVRTPEEARAAEWLFALAHARLQGTPTATLIAKVKSQARAA